MKEYLIIVASIFLTACTFVRYTYRPENYRSEKIFIKGHLVEEFDNENSPLNNIWISDFKNPPVDIKILSPTVKLVSNGKEYIVHTEPDSEHIYVYKQGVIIRGDFIAYIGKIQLSNGEIIDIPPIKFKKNVYVEKYNPVMDSLDHGDRIKIFSGTVEDYKKGKK